MSMPSLTVTGQEMYDALTPIMVSDQPGMSDADNEYVGAVLCAALATMVDPVSDVVRTSPAGVPGYANRFDIENVTDPLWLAWVAQFVGDSQAVQTASTVEAMQAIIMTPQNFTRGRPATIRSAAKNTLTGTQEVIYNPAVGGNPFVLGITTFTSETPDSQATDAAVFGVLPAWILVSFATVSGGDYATLTASHSTYTLMQAEHTSYADVLANPAA